ncbi:MAG: hypothetical protein Lokiarch_35490 [Candidatus Lokiarchaeum sp. GC14_75]|nr:MAG: hypothetical protein Lokiarch_35490 [Candidatus Lokiarchaeum sp. GC14_75]
MERQDNQIQELFQEFIDNQNGTIEDVANFTYVLYNK